MTRRHLEPNASHYSARYAERKRAAQRARDMAAPPPPCLHCPTTHAPGSLFCAEHAAEYDRRLERAKAGEMSFQECVSFCERTYWPEAAR